MKITKKPFGQTKDGAEVELYTLADGGVSVDIITYGAAIRAIKIPVGGKVRDVALGFDDVKSYEANQGYHGAIVGRVGNRIADSAYTMNGKTYKVDANTPPHSLHGGFVGFDKQIWTAAAVPDTDDAEAMELTLVDREGTAAGYPGDLTVSVKYTLKNGTLGIEYTATCTEDTPINLTNHVYFNLAGHGSGSITGHKISIHGDHITAMDDKLIVRGDMMDVTGTPFDLRAPRLISDGIDSEHVQIGYGGGYDHNWVLSDKPCRPLSKAAVLECDGVTMECHTTKPGIQFYSGNMMAGETGKEGAVYSKRTGLCLETQYFPNSVNIPAFPAPILKKGETYRHKTTYSFAAEG